MPTSRALVATPLFLAQSARVCMPANWPFTKQRRGCLGSSLASCGGPICTTRPPTDAGGASLGCPPCRTQAPERSAAIASAPGYRRRWPVLILRSCSHSMINLATLRRPVSSSQLRIASDAGLRRCCLSPAASATRPSLDNWPVGPGYRRAPVPPVIGGLGRLGRVGVDQAVGRPSAPWPGLSGWSSAPPRCWLVVVRSKLPAIFSP